MRSFGATAGRTGIVGRGLGVVLELIRLHPGPFVVSVVGAALSAGGTVAATIVLGRVTDRLVLPTFETGEPPPGALAWTVLAVAAVTVIRAAGTVARRYFVAMASERAQVSYRRRLADRYLALPLAWHQQVPTGQLLAHVDSDTEVTTNVIHPLPFSLGVGFLAFFSTVALLAVDVTIAVVALAIFPSLTVLNRIYSRRVEGPAADVQAGVGVISSIAHESFDGALIVKTLGRAGAETERFAAAARQLQRDRQRVGFIRSGFEAALDALPNLGIVGVVVVGAFRIQAGAMTLGDLVQVAALFAILALPMRVLGYFLETLPPSVVARERLERVLAQPLPAVPAESVTPGPRPALEARAVTHTYPNPAPRPPLAGNGTGRTAPVLAGVDLTIAPGEVVALVGSTGSGKSTLCLLLAGLIPPTSGEVLLDGTPMSAIDPDRRAESVAIVFQEAFLFADTVRANVDLGRSLDHRSVEAALATAQVDRFLAELPDGLDTVIGERGVTLSGGQRQRVALARALAGRPQVLILDDATSAVDPVVEREILVRLRAEVEGAALLVAQRVSTIELADRVLYLQDGRIAAAGSHRELLTDARYAQLVAAYETGKS